MRPSAFLFVLLLSGSVVAGELRVATAIDEVTVYLDGAEVVRTGSVDVPVGGATLRVEGLAAALDPDSLSVRASGPAGLVVSSVESRRVFGEALAQPRERELDAELQVAQDARALLLARKAALDTQAKFIDGLAALPARGGDQERAFLPPDQWPAAWEAVGRGMAQTNESRTRLDRELREADARIERLRQEIAQLRTGRKDSVTATVHLEAAMAGRASIALAYRIGGAGWAPQYDARLDSERGRVAIQRAATVRQATGESWHNVALTVTTGRPSGGAAMPELSPWWVGFLEPRPVRQKAQAEAMMDELAPRAAAPAPAELRQAQSIGTDFSARYRIPGRVSLAADGSPQRFAIASQETAARIFARTAPKLDARAFLYAEFTLEADAPLPGGDWRLVRDGVYVGETRRATLRPGETLALAFGADDALQVEYKPLADTRGAAGLFGKRRQVERRWQVTVTNGHRTALPVTVFDQVPVSREDELEVNLSDDSTPPSARDFEDRAGVLAWHLDLAPRAKGEVRFGYTVSYPQDKTVPGF